MTDLIFTQSWVYNARSELAIEEAAVLVECNDGITGEHLFVGAEPEPWSIEVTDASICQIEHTVYSSDVETLSNCGESILVVSDARCDYVSTVFDVTVPTLNIFGGAILITMILALAWRFK